MDPNANLAEQLRLTARIIAQLDQGSPDLSNMPDMASRLAELVQALDEWICKGGFLPARWER